MEGITIDKEILMAILFILSQFFLVVIFFCFSNLNSRIQINRNDIERNRNDIERIGKINKDIENNFRKFENDLYDLKLKNRKL